MAIYKTRIDLTIDPVWHQDPPDIIVRIGEDYFWSGSIMNLTTFSHHCNIPMGTSSVSVEMINKKDTDTVGDLDRAVIIKSVVFNDIKSDKLLWQGKYYPRYPEPWASEQKQAGQNLEESLPAHTYLGWNGIWVLEFGVPAFTWIHQVEGLGWIYD
jgi:hypothetical protein